MSLIDDIICYPFTIYVTPDSLAQEYKMMGYYYTGTHGCALIAADDLRSLSAARKHGLTRANTCGDRIRHVAPLHRFERFRKEIG